MPRQFRKAGQAPGAEKVQKWIQNLEKTGILQQVAAAHQRNRPLSGDVVKHFSKIRETFLKNTGK